MHKHLTQKPCKWVGFSLQMEVLRCEKMSGAFQQVPPLHILWTWDCITSEQHCGIFWNKSYINLSSYSCKHSPLPHIRDVRLCLWRKLRSNSCCVRPGDAPAIIRAVASYKNTRGSADWKCQLQETLNVWVRANRPLNSTTAAYPYQAWSFQWPLCCSASHYITFHIYNLVMNSSNVYLIRKHGHKAPHISGQGAKTGVSGNLYIQVALPPAITTHKY